MYNTELKTKFIRQYTQSIGTAKNAESIFNAMQPYEEEWGADLCTRSTEELQSALDSILSLRGKSQTTPLVILREYAKWCIENHVPKAGDGALHVELAGGDKIRRQMVSGPVHLERCLNALFDSPDKETVDVVYRCYFWMAFAGLDEKDALLVKESDIDFGQMEIVYNGSHFPIYREALPAFKKACELRDFCYEHPYYKSSVRKTRAVGELLLRGMKQPVATAIRTIVVRHTAGDNPTGTTEHQISYKRIKLSGLFYRMYERERAGLPADFSGAASDFVAEKDYNLNGITIQSLQNREAKHYMNDYRRWKLAFSF